MGGGLNENTKAGDVFELDTTSNKIEKVEARVEDSLKFSSANNASVALDKNRIIAFDDALVLIEYKAGGGVEKIKSNWRGL